MTIVEQLKQQNESVLQQMEFMRKEVSGWRCGMFSTMYVVVESNKKTITKDSVHKLHTQLDSFIFVR